MNIGIVGLGLIGGSMAKAISAYTNHRVFGLDKDEVTLNDAISRQAISRELTDKNIHSCHIIILALYPDGCIDFLKEHGDKISHDAIVIDCSGVKKYIVERALPLSDEFGFTFVGCHPMAGLHFSGFAYSTEELFKGASFIICTDNSPNKPSNKKAIDEISELALSVGFGSVKLTDANEHDKVVAFTSHLCHIVSNAYVKNSAADEHMGFSAGSYKDLTRIAKLNEDMWTELFLENRENIITQLDELVANLLKYSEAMKSNNYSALHDLLKEGRERKEAIDGRVYRD